jgi:hypothetical protein
LPFAPAHRGNLCSALLCPEQRAGNRVLRLPRAPAFFLIPVLSVFLNTPPPPFLSCSVSFLLQHLFVVLFSALLTTTAVPSSHRVLGKSPNLSARVSTGHTCFLPARTGQALFIHPSRQSAPFWSFFASARFIACNKRATACCGSTSGASPFCLFLFLLETRRSPLVLATRPVGNAARLPAAVVLFLLLFTIVGSRPH